MSSEDEFFQEVYTLWCATVDQLGEQQRSTDLSVPSENSDLLRRLTESAKAVSYLENPEFIQRIRQQRDINPPLPLSWGSVPALRFGPHSSIRPFPSAIRPNDTKLPSVPEIAPNASVTDEERLAALVMYTVIIRSCCRNGLVTKTYEPSAFNPTQTETYCRGRVLQVGNNGVVYGVLNHPDRRVLAVKDWWIQPRSESPAQRREDQLLRNVNHPNLVRFIASHHQGISLHVYSEYVAGGTIGGMAAALGPMPEEETRAVIKQGDSLLIAMDGVVKIADLGMFKPGIPKEAQALKRALPWMSPEVLKESSYGLPTDVWNIGCVILEMHLGINPWTRMRLIDAVKQIAAAQWPPIDRVLSKDLQATLEKVFVVEAKRISSAAMQMETWVKGEADH